MSKDKYLDEIQLYKLFKEAFGNKAEVYRNVYYHDGNVRKEIDIVIKQDNINFIVCLNGKKNDSLKDAKRSSSHNEKQLRNFLFASYADDESFYIYGANNNKEYGKLTKNGVYFLISVVYHKNGDGCINTFGESCSKPYIETGLFAMNLSYSCLYFMLRTCIYGKIDFKSFATYLGVAANNKEYIPPNCALSIEFTMLLLKDIPGYSTLLFVDKSIDTVYVDNTGILPCGLKFFSFTYRSDDTIFTYGQIPCTESRYLMVICENIAKNAKAFSYEDRVDVYKLAQLASIGEVYCLLKHNGHICCNYNDAKLYINKEDKNES